MENEIKVGEIWKDIPNYENIYQISNLGRLRSLHYGKIRIMKQTIRCKNYQYYFAGLSKNNKRKFYAIHRLVALAFLGESNLQVDHKDGNKLNNRLDNLEYVTPKENTQRAWDKGLAKNTEHQRKVAREVMLKRWQNNNHRNVNGIKRTKEEKRKYRKDYYKKHKVTKM